MSSLIAQKKFLYEILFKWVWIIPCMIKLSSGSHDLVLEHMCSTAYGDKFWKDLIECSTVLNKQFFTAVNTCIPTATETQAESTRNYICGHPEKWNKMMDCVNMQLIELGDEKDPHMELNPGVLYTTCVNVLIKEAEYSFKTGEPFLQENRTES